MIDGGGLLYKVYWPTKGTVKDLVDGVENYLQKLSTDGDVIIVFDRYKENSIKSDTRNSRMGSFKRCHQLTIGRELPPRETCFSSCSTKENLIEIIANEIITRYQNEQSKHKLIVSSKNDLPIEVNLGVKIQRIDLRSNFEEADHMIQQQVQSVVIEGIRKSVKVISSDTDVFVLLCSNFDKHNWQSVNLYMDTCRKQQADIYQQISRG